MILQFFAKTLQQLDLTGVLDLSSLGLKAAGVAAVTCSCGLPWCTSASGLGQAPCPRHMSNIEAPTVLRRGILLDQKTAL